MSISAESFKGQNFISMKDYNRDALDFLLEKSDEMIPKAEWGSSILSGKVMASLFFEPSTRTRLSFESSMQKLGGSVTGFAQAGVSSVAKGESLEDTIRTVENYCDIIVIRHPEETSSIRASQVSSVPVINAGSGSWEHPTQALLDLHCIKHAFGVIDGLSIALCGDLLYGRTVHSLIIALTKYDVDVTLVSPPQLRLRDDIKRDVEGKIQYVEVEDLKEVVPNIDVLYVTRIQKERFSDPEVYKRFRDVYLVDKKLVEAGREKLIVMHPLPRVNEIHEDVDGLPNAWYFKQVRHGVYTRMALLSLIVGC